MAWEWHDRERDRHGRFAARHNKQQLHLRLAPEQAELIRTAARAAAMEISAYVWRTMDEAWKAQLTGDGDPVATSGAARPGGPPLCG